MERRISILEPGGYIIYYFFVILIVLLAFTAGKRAFCHYVCWIAPFMVIGNKIKSRIGLPTLSIIAEEDKCIGCKRCNNSCPMSLPVEEFVRQGSLNHSECILCGECIDGCPKEALTFSFGRKAKHIPNKIL
ncbi:MAG: 4Fe-4S binding protein [Clostridiales bacterium]|nr:4Fe-4S binding protein [Clostridiales bacterium]